MISYKQKVKNLLYYKAVKLKCYAFISPEIITSIDNEHEDVWEDFCELILCINGNWEDSDICPNCFIAAKCSTCTWEKHYGLCRAKDSLYNITRHKFGNCDIEFVDILDIGKTRNIIGDHDG